MNKTKLDVASSCHWREMDCKMSHILGENMLKFGALSSTSSLIKYSNPQNLQNLKKIQSIS